MSINYMTLVNVVNVLNGWREYPAPQTLEHQLVQSLEVYKRRGEFDGTMRSAFECLSQAEYEFETNWFGSAS
jgi:hypothetical protein